MIDARFSAEDGELVIDCSEACPLARSVLESPRSRAALERAFGITRKQAEPSSEREVPKLASPPKVPREKRPSPSPSGMSLEELSSFIGADLLMSKPVHSGDIADSEEVDADDGES
jgi:hypothetical protein